MIQIRETNDLRCYAFIFTIVKVNSKVFYHTTSVDTGLKVLFSGCGMLDRIVSGSGEFQSAWSMQQRKTTLAICSGF